MTRLAPADQLAALMRVQVAALRKDAGARTTGRRAGDAAAPAAPAGSDPAVVAAERIRGIAPDDPARQRKAVRAYLECVLLSELGAQLVTDPAFSRMVDHVEERLLADPDLARAAAQAAQALLGSARS